MLRCRRCPYSSRVPCVLLPVVRNHGNFDLVPVFHRCRREWKVQCAKLVHHKFDSPSSIIRGEVRIWERKWGLITRGFLIDEELRSCFYFQEC